MTNRVLIFSSGRSDWAHLKPVWDALCSAHPGSVAIEQVTSEGAAVIANSARVMDELKERIGRHKPDWLLVHGDRYEAMAAAFAASCLHVPIAHIEGGDFTCGGCTDDLHRDSITAMAALHFPTSAQARARLLGLGQRMEAIVPVGVPSLDLARREVVPFEHDGRPLAVACQHAVGAQDAAQQAEATRAALAELSRREWRIVVIGTRTGDPGSADMADRIAPPFADRIEHMPYGAFFGLLDAAAKSGGCMLGNSSAAIKEAPFFRLPAVNIGDRQLGRARAANVVDAPHSLAEILDAVAEATSAQFAQRMESAANPYDSAQGRSGVVIAEALAKTVPFRKAWRAA